MCRINLPSSVVHTGATKSAFESHKARMISALVLLIPKANMIMNLLSQLILVNSALLEYFFKKIHLDP